jgi:hypothetical protein
MKNVAVCLLALTLAMGFTTQSDQMAPKAPLMTLKGTIKADGDKYTFVNDKDGKSWDVINPETLKGHEGHHVQLSAHVYADKHAIHVMSVTMLKADAMGGGSMNH